MTKEELAILRLNARVIALESLVRGLYSGLAGMTPTAGDALRAKFADLRREHAGMSLPGYPAEYSDMISSEYQEALDRLLVFIERGFPE